MLLSWDMKTIDKLMLFHWSFACLIVSSCGFSLSFRTQNAKVIRGLLLVFNSLDEDPGPDPGFAITLKVNFLHFLFLFSKISIFLSYKKVNRS